jgi:nicotinamidase-related amidase
MDKNDIEILAVIDMQPDFIDGVLPNLAAQKIIPAIIREINAWDGAIIATRDTHLVEDYKNSIEGQRLPIHCIKGTEGWEVQKDIKAALDKKGATYVDKHNFGFINWPKVLFNIDSTDQDAVAALTAGKKIRIRIVGTCTDICNMAFLVICRTWFPNAIIELVADASAASGLTEEDVAKNQEAALRIARSMLCDVVQSVAA